MTISSQKYQLYCQFCHYKKVFGNNEIQSLSLSKSADIQAGIPKLDQSKKNIEMPPVIRGKSKSKCPNCGRMIFVTRYHEPKQDDNPS